jgi:hypothetical protein
MISNNNNKEQDQLVKVSVAQVILEGNLRIPKNAQGIVIFAH